MAILVQNAWEEGGGDSLKTAATLQNVGLNVQCKLRIEIITSLMMISPPYQDAFQDG